MALTIQHHFPTSLYHSIWNLTPTYPLIYLIFLSFYSFPSSFCLFFLHNNVATSSVSIVAAKKRALRKRGKGIQYNEFIVESARQRKGLVSSIGSLLTISQHKEGKIVFTLCVCPTFIHHHQGEEMEKKRVGEKVFMCVLWTVPHLCAHHQKEEGWGLVRDGDGGDN